MSEYAPPDECVFVSSTTSEPRSQHVVDLKTRSVGVTFVEVTAQDQFSFEIGSGGTKEKILLADRDRLDALWANWVDSDAPIVVDITGLEHQVWAAVLVSALATWSQVRVVYVEPKKYRRTEMPGSGSDLFDLTSRFAGLAPLAGFSRLSEPDEADFLFVPLLGFEGRRLSLMLDGVAPENENVFPVIGVPGFQPEFVYFAYEGNRDALLEGDSYLRTRFATANCPFSLYERLESLSNARPDQYMKVAPIGTKPHSLGALLYACRPDREVELVYDFPIRKDKRTDGSARLLDYDVSELWNREGLWVP